MRTLLACALIAAPAFAEVPAGTQIAVLGEVHDNPEHHAEQARLVAGFAPQAVVWEMVSPGQLSQAATVNRADPVAFGEALGWAAAGWPDFAMYHPIFMAAGDAEHLGAAVPREELRAAMTQGAAAVLGVGPIDLGPLAPEDQAAREEEQAVAHCGALPEAMLPGMVEAQRLRDARMAQLALEALDRGGPVVVITGTGHARTDTGVPALLRNARPDVVVWALGQVESDPGPDAPFDAVNVTAPQPRPDPCLAFR
jgi:uncharacterized iron-regulated protein